MSRIPAYCGECRAVRSVNDWRETARETLTLVLGPCGHRVRRPARLEWSTDREIDRVPEARAGRARIARARDAGWADSSGGRTATRTGPAFLPVPGGSGTRDAGTVSSSTGHATSA